MRQLLYFLVLSVTLIPTKGIAQVPALLDPKTQPQFKNVLPIPAVIDARGGGTFTIPVSQFRQDLGLKDASGKPLLTTVWGYHGTYPGPTILVKSGEPINVFWENKLVDPLGDRLPHLLPVDVSLDWALKDLGGLSNGVPIVTHLHGGQTESAFDGLPDAWYTPGFSVRGKECKMDKDNPYYTYTNRQEAATIWYHDHALGITRLNVYAGLAGYYIVTDDNEMALQNAGKLPAGPYDIGLAIQDRMFTSDGELHYPAAPPVPNAPNPSVQPEFFGNFILVNGMTWPLLDVEPRQYRFRLLNGSDSRFYNLFLSTGQPMIQIASDVGFLPAPVSFSQVLIAPGERKDVIIDFTNYKGQTVILRNNARTPFPMGAAVDPLTTGRIMAFRVKPSIADPEKFPPTILPTSLRTVPIPVLTTSRSPRQLLLFEGGDSYGRLKTMLGTLAEGAKGYHEGITENPALGSTEIWEIYNTTPDAHPIHLHMVKLQLLNRQRFSATVDAATGTTTKVRLVGSPKAPGPEEKGWKDTYIMYPGEVTRIITKFEIEGLSVWHCHILSHEDNEMMRPYFIGAMPVNGMITRVSEATPELEKELQLRLLPNPFNSELQIQLQLPQASPVSISIYDVSGRRVQQVFSGEKGAGLQQFRVDGSGWSNGTYFCEIVVNNQRMVRKLTLAR